MRRAQSFRRPPVPPLLARLRKGLTGAFRKKNTPAVRRSRPAFKTLAPLASDSRPRVDYGSFYAPRTLPAAISRNALTIPRLSVSISGLALFTSWRARFEANATVQNVSPSSLRP
jgi:hypothetical protein